MRVLLLGLVSVFAVGLVACETASKSNTSSPPKQPNATAQNIDTPVSPTATIVVPNPNKSHKDINQQKMPTETLAPALIEGKDKTPNYLNSYSLNNDEFGTQVTVTVKGDTRMIISNALPDHATGYFPNAGNPNTISPQNVSHNYVTNPVWVGSATDVRITGVAINGVKFEPGTAERITCESGERFRVEGLQDVFNLGMDFNNAHVQPSGEYHYHGVSQLLVDAYASGDDLVHVGFAADGFLMYYSKSGRYKSSFALITAPRAGENCTASGPGGSRKVKVAGTTPDGTYTSDWTYRESSGDLDSCNGITIDGKYIYLITNGYPYVGRCLNGEVSEKAPTGGPPGADQYACNINPDGFCIFTGLPHQKGLKPGTDKIINSEGNVLFNIDNAIATDASGKTLAPTGKPAAAGDSLKASSHENMSDDEKAFHKVMAIMFPIRNALMYDISDLSIQNWEELTTELRVRGIKETSFTSGSTPKDNYYSREDIFTLAKNPDGKDIHHPVMKFLEESGLYLLCHVTTDEFNAVLKEAHPEGHDPCGEAVITSKVPFNG